MVMLVVVVAAVVVAITAVATMVLVPYKRLQYQQ